MSKLPKSLNAYNVSKENIEEFKGLDHNERTQSGAWYDMQNMTLDDYPVASVRRQRKIVKSPVNESNEYIEDGSSTSYYEADDAVMINGKVALLQNATIETNKGYYKGQVLINTDGAVESFKKASIEGTISFNNNELKQFRKNWCFFGAGEPICNIAGRWYEFRTKETFTGNEIAFGGVVTTDDNWTYPMLISDKKGTIEMYYNDAFSTIPVDWSRRFIRCTYIREYTDEYGKTWYVSQNSAALQVYEDENKCDVNYISSKIKGKAKYLGKFTSWQDAANALIKIYYSESVSLFGLEAALEMPFYEVPDELIDVKHNADSKVFLKNEYMTDYWRCNDISERVMANCYSAYKTIYFNNISQSGKFVKDAHFEYLSEHQKDFLDTRNDVSSYYISTNLGNIRKAEQDFHQQCRILVKSGNANAIAMCNNYGNGLFDGQVRTNNAFEFYFYDTKITRNDVSIGTIDFQVDKNGKIKSCATRGTPFTAKEYTCNFLYELSDEIKNVLFEGKNNIKIKNDEIFSLDNKDYIVNYNGKYCAMSTSNINPKWLCEQQIKPVSTNVTIEIQELKNRQNLEDMQLLNQSQSGECKSMIKSGNKILIIPDGVIIDVEKRTVQKIAYKEVFLVGGDNNTASLMTTCDGDENTYNCGFINLNSDSIYRIVNGTLQKKITLNDRSMLWSDIPSYVSFSYENARKFDNFKKGDNIEVSMSLKDKSLDETKFKKGLFEYDNSAEKLKVGSYKIQKVGGTFIDISAPLINYEIDDSNWITGFDSTKNEFELTIEKKFPEVMPFGALCGNRIWLCQKDGHEIYASSLGDYTNYYDFSGLASDSWSANVGSDGEFTGIVNYLGSPLIFKEDTLYIVSGSQPSEYSYTEINNFKGVEAGSERSFAIIDNVLYYKSAYGIIAYDGSTTIISQSLGKEKYCEAVAGAYGNKYYVSMKNVNTNKYELFCYDTKKGMWTKEKEEKVIRFINNGNSLYYVTENAVKLVESNGASNEDKVNWYVETGVYGYSYPNKKYISRLQTRLYLAQGSTARFYIQYNSDGVWHSCGREVIGKGVNSVLFPIRPKRCDHMKIKIEGKGECKIYSITKCLEVGGDI